MSALDTSRSLVTMTWALALVAPLALLREFGRRFSFAHLHTGTVLVLDTAVAVTQLGMLGWFARTGALSASTAIYALGAGCGATGAAWLYFARGNFAIRTHLLPQTMRQSWHLGKWLLANQLTLTLQAQINYWLLTWMAGATATGVYAACMSVASLPNPVLVGSANILIATAPLALLKGGAVRLQSETIRASVLLGAGMILFCLIVAFAGEHLVHFLFRGQEYAGQGRIMILLALGQLAIAVGLPAFSALASLGRSRELFLSDLLGVAVILILAWLLIAEWGLEGAGYAFLGGMAARSAARWLALLILVRDHDIKEIGR